MVAKVKGAGRGGRTIEHPCLSRAIVCPYSFLRQLL